MKDQTEKLHIALISVHGLIRSQNLQLGQDADTGGQTLYVMELAEALARHPSIAQVDLVTRLVADDAVSEDYAQPIEYVTDKLRIVRIEAGPEQYLPKEQLWDYLDSFADNLAHFFSQHNTRPDIIHSHYADAGYVGALLANQLAIPLVHTGHSLGRVKRKRLLASGLTAQQVEASYNMSRRIEAEELVLATAERVITSTHQEIEEQYELYDHYQPQQMRVIPPGTDLKQFRPPIKSKQNSRFVAQITGHLHQHDKPIILALSRPDKRKNIITLVEAYGQSAKLQKMANLVIVAGNRDDVDDLDSGAQEVFHELLIAIDRYDLYGKVALPKHHSRSQVPDIYRLAAASGGVFVNPALTEPFGLTLIEAAASGLPIVATEDGGPRDIVGNCSNGLLIDPLDADTISKALIKLLSNKTLWQKYVDNGIRGVREHYSWDAHADHYVSLVSPLAKGVERLERQPLQRREDLYGNRALVADLDQSLIGDEAALQSLIALLREHRKTTYFAIATGRRLDSALRLMKKHHIPEPDVLITSGGTEICYAPKLTVDEAWSKHIDHHWTPHKVREHLDELEGLERQPKSEQSRFKLSYYFDSNKISIEYIERLLHREEQSVHVQVAFGQFLDILPQRASKGQALRYIAELWQIPLERIFVAGGSGADEDMMRGNTLAAVVANRHHEELSQLIDMEKIYFANKPFAAGILEALDHYHFFE